MSRDASKLQQVEGIPLSYYDACTRIEQLASAGMPQTTAYTVAPQPTDRTPPEPRKVYTFLSCPSQDTPSVGSRTMDKSISRFTGTRTLTPRCGSRRLIEVDKFDHNAAYSALLERLEAQLDDEERRAASA